MENALIGGLGYIIGGLYWCNVIVIYPYKLFDFDFENWVFKIGGFDLQLSLARIFLIIN